MGGNERVPDWLGVKPHKALLNRFVGQTDHLEEGSEDNGQDPKAHLPPHWN